MIYAIAHFECECVPNSPARALPVTTSSHCAEYLHISCASSKDVMLLMSSSTSPYSTIHGHATTLSSW